MRPDIKKIRDGILAKIAQDTGREFTNPIARLEGNSEKSLKYSEILFRIKEQFIEAKVNKIKVYSKKYKEFKFNSTYLLKNKQDIDSFIESDDEYMVIYRDYKDLENLVEIVGNMVDTYKQREATERFIFRHVTGMQ